MAHDAAADQHGCNQRTFTASCICHYQGNSFWALLLQDAAASKGKGKGGRRGGKSKGSSAAPAGASTVSSGIKLEDISITFKNQQVLRGVTWDVKKGERVGLVGAGFVGGAATCVESVPAVRTEPRPVRMPQGLLPNAQASMAPVRRRSYRS